MVTAALLTSVLRSTYGAALLTKYVAVTGAPCARAGWVSIWLRNALQPTGSRTYPPAVVDPLGAQLSANSRVASVAPAARVRVKRKLARDFRVHAIADKRG